MTCLHVNLYIVTMTIWVPRLEGKAGPRYRAIADALDEDLVEGRLQPGARLPTHRELADRLGVTVGTVTRAYAEAARRGLLAGEVGRGTFVRSPAADAGRWSPAVAPDPAVIDLSLNLPPPPEGFAAEAALRDALASLADADVAPLLAYAEEGGHPAHREAGAALIAQTGLAATADDVVVCCGGQHALTVLLAMLAQPGDLVAAEALTYAGLKAVAGLLRLRLHGVAMDDQGIRPDAFEAACRSGARVLYCVPTIQNPTAVTMSAERRGAIAEIARRHGVAVLEDDVHALLPGVRPLPIAAALPELGYYVLGTSKILTPGLRVGFVRAPAHAAARLAAAVRATTWGPVPLTAEIAARWIRDGTAGRLIEGRRRAAALRQALARSALAGTPYQSHPFGYYLWVPLPEPWRGEAFVAEARRRGVAVSSGEAFVVGRGATPHAVRICLGAPRDAATLEQGLRRLGDLLARGADPVLAVL